MSSTGAIDCTGDNLSRYSDTQTPDICHVCLSTGAVVGLSFHAQMGLISLAALLVLLYIIARNYYRNVRNPPPGPWRLFRGNVDILMLNLIVSDILMSFGAISDIHWAYHRQVFCGSYCNAQGILQTMGETAAALSTLSVATYTFVAVKTNRRPSYKPWHCLAVVVAIWLWVLLWSVILLAKHDDAYTPTPWWCWINGKYMPERVMAEYLWLWIAGICTIGLYVPAYYIVRNQQNSSGNSAGNSQRDADALSVVSSINEGNEAVKMLWYPLAYTFCVLPLSIIRWAGFAHPELLKRPQILPVSMVFSSIFNLMGLINVVLIFWTRPAILLIGSDGCLSPADPRIADKDDEEIRMPVILPRDTRVGAQQDDEPSSRRRVANGFGGMDIRLHRDEL